MKYLIAVCCLFLAVAAFADVKIVQKVKTDGIMGQKPQDGTMTMYIKDGKARIESSSDENYQIFDVQSGKMYMVEPSKKEALVVSAEQMKQATNLISQLMGGKNAAPPSVQKLGTTKTYNGYKCEEYKVSISAPMQSSGVYCVSSEIDLDKEFEPLMNFSQELAQIFGGDALKNISGFPVHSESTLSIMGQNIKSMSELVSYNRDSQPDSLFVVPPDYKVKEAPVPGMK